LNLQTQPIAFCPNSTVSLKNCKNPCSPITPRGTNMVTKRVSGSPGGTYNNIRGCHVSPPISRRNREERSHAIPIPDTAEDVSDVVLGPRHTPTSRTCAQVAGGGERPQGPVRQLARNRGWGNGPMRSSPPATTGNGRTSPPDIIVRASPDFPNTQFKK